MSEEPQDPSDMISRDLSSNSSESNSDTPEVGVGLIVLGTMCLIFGIAIGLVFTAKWSKAFDGHTTLDPSVRL